MPEYKSNHFVPKAYLKRWSHPLPWKNKGQMIWMKQKINGKINRVPIDNQCQKNNFYTLPEDFDFEDKKTIEKHWFGYSDDLYSKSMNNSLDQGKKPTDYKDVGNLILHAIWQCYRTPKFKIETEKKFIDLKKQNPKLDDTGLDYTHQLTYLMVKTFPIFQEKVIPEFIFSPMNNWFITSDNPASFWLNNWNSKIYLPTLFGTDINSTNLEILCPLNPQCCLLLKLNQISKPKKIIGIKRSCRSEEVKSINRSIFTAADKTIYSLNEDSLSI